MEPTEENKKDFLEVFEELSDSLFQHCYFRVSNRETAKDLVQEAFIKTWEQVVAGKEISNPKAFLYKVTNNLVIDHYRKRKESSLDAILEKGFDVKEGSEGNVEDFAEIEQILLVLDKLEEKHREIIIMRFIDELSPKEIGEITGQTENAVSVGTNRALKKLRELLD